MDWLLDILMYVALALCVLVLILLFRRRGPGDRESDKPAGRE